MDKNTYMFSRTFKPTLNHGVECNDTWLPGINKCNWMGAYYGTQTIYGDLRAPYGDTPLHGEVNMDENQDNYLI